MQLCEMEDASLSPMMGPSWLQETTGLYSSPYSGAPRSQRSMALWLAALSMLSPASTALGVALGGALPNRPTSWVDFSPYSAPLSRLPINLPRSASSKLARVRANLSLQIAELARILRVERPTIYAWTRDENIALRAENAERLARLEEVALAWHRLATLPIGNLVRQRSASGESVVSLLEQERYAEATELLRAIAASAGTRPPRRVASIRETLEKHGLESKIRATRDEIDRASR